MAHATSFSSVAIGWKPISEEHANGLLMGYVVRLVETADETYGCRSNLEMTIRGLEKFKVYSLQVAGFTSKGHGNFSEPIVVVTNIDGKGVLFKKYLSNYAKVT